MRIKTKTEMEMEMENPETRQGWSRKGGENREEEGHRGDKRKAEIQREEKKIHRVGE